MRLETAPARGKRSTALGMLKRRQRIFAGLRDGLSYEEIATQEGVTRERIRQIVYKVLKTRSVDSAADHAKLQLARLAPLMRLAAGAVDAGEVAAITPYLKVLDRLDRYQTVAVANVAYDDEARRKLMEKINRMVDNLTARKEAAALAAAPADGVELAAAAADGAELGGAEAAAEEPGASEAQGAEPFAWG